MKSKSLAFGFVLLAALIMWGIPMVHAATTQPATQAVFDRLMGAIQVNDRDAFLKQATPEMNAAITTELMEKVNHDLGPRLAKGFTGTYLATVKQQGCEVNLWKVTFNDGSDDVVLRVVMKGELLAGFFRE